MDKIKEYIMDKFGDNKAVVVCGVLLIGFLMIAAYTVADSVVLDSGQVIDIPEWGETCEYHELYCPKGWAPDGTFPHAPFRASFFELLKNPPDMPECAQFTFGGAPVYPCYTVTAE